MRHAGCPELGAFTCCENCLYLPKSMFIQCKTGLNNLGRFSRPTYTVDFRGLLPAGSKRGSAFGPTHVPAVGTDIRQRHNISYSIWRILGGLHSHAHSDGNVSQQLKQIIKITIFSWIPLKTYSRITAGGQSRFGNASIYATHWGSTSNLEMQFRVPCS